MLLSSAGSESEAQQQAQQTNSETGCSADTGCSGAPQRQPSQQAPEQSQTSHHQTKSKRKWAPETNCKLIHWWHSTWAIPRVPEHGILLSAADRAMSWWDVTSPPLECLCPPAPESGERENASALILGPNTLQPVASFYFSRILWWGRWQALPGRWYLYKPRDWGEWPVWRIASGLSLPAQQSCQVSWSVVRWDSSLISVSFPIVSGPQSWMFQRHYQHGVRCKPNNSVLSSSFPLLSKLLVLWNLNFFSCSIGIF